MSGDKLYHESKALLQAIIEKLDPEDVLERLEWTTEELVDALALDILYDRAKFQDLLDFEFQQLEDDE